MNFKAFASTVVGKDGKYLLVQEGKPENYGLWNLPGGHVDPGEHLIAAAIREAKEEASLEVEIENLLGVFSDVRDYHSFHFMFNGKIVNGTPKTGDNILDCKWVTLDEWKDIPEYETLNYWKFQKVIERLEAGMSYPLEVIAERNW